MCKYIVLIVQQVEEFYSCHWHQTLMYLLVKYTESKNFIIFFIIFVHMLSSLDNEIVFYFLFYSSVVDSMWWNKKIAFYWLGEQNFMMMSRCARNQKRNWKIKKLLKVWFCQIWAEMGFLMRNNFLVLERSIIWLKKLNIFF